MNPVTMLILPHNGRMDVDPEGSEAMLGAFTPLPVPMPRSVTAWTDPETGKPIALWCDDLRIRPCDFATVLEGVRQFNNDIIAASGRSTEPVLSGNGDAAIVEELEDWDG
jgi:hypothetical protein